MSEACWHDLKASKADLWDYYREFCKVHDAEGITDLCVQRDKARERVAEIENLIRTWPEDHSAIEIVIKLKELLK